MGILLLIVPLLIYYVLIVPILKIKVINEIQSKKLKTLAFILLLLFPIGDHLIGYVVYKTLCYTKGGVNIYKTVTDEQEQRDYWFINEQLFAVSDPSSKYGIIKTERYINDFKSRKAVYTNFCKYKKLDCEDAKEYIKKHNIEVYKPVKILNIKRDKLNDSYLSEASLKVDIVINEDKKELEYGYLNYCNPKHNTLPKTDPNYKQSCTNADKIIKKYKLKNVIEVPSSPYSFYSIASDKGSSREVFLFPFIGKDYQKIYNMKTGEILAEYKGFSFWGGWYINLFNPYHPSALSRCGKKDSKDLYSFKELVIPNPYKNKKKD